MTNVTTVPGNQRPCGYQQLLNFNAVQSLTIPPAPAPPARPCIITPTANCRYRDDGVNPTAALGLPMPANIPLLYDGDLTKFRIIPQSGSATADIVYYS